MKNLIVGSLIALAAGAGCTTDNAHVAATWELANVSNNTVTGCPSGFDTAALFNSEVDGNGNEISPCSSLADSNEQTCFVDLFDCSAGAGLSFPLPPTRYKTWVQIMDHPAASLYAASVPAFVDITDVDQTYSTQILNDGGYFFFNWILKGATSGQTLTCASAPGGIDSLATDVSTPSNSASDTFDCEQGAGYTAGFLAATYTVSIAALNNSDQSVGTAPTLTGKTIRDRNQVTDLGPVMIPITGM